MPQDLHDGLIKAVHDRFPGATFPETAHPPTPPGKLYVNDSYFGASAPVMWPRGWRVYPQTRRGRDGLTTKRTPAIIDGTMIRISALADGLPSAKDQADWLLNARSLNTALYLGPAAGGPWALDIDVRMPELSGPIEAVIREMLPATPFWRRSDGAKRVALFRSDPADPITRKKDHQLLGEDGTPIRDSYGKVCAIEILAAGSSVTIGGLHHSTGDLLSWEAWPEYHGPEEAPLVGAAQVRACLDAISERVVLLTGLGRGYDAQGARLAMGAVTAQRVDSSGVVVPGNREGTKGAVFDRRGRVVDGREAYVLSRSMRYVVANPELMASQEGRHAVAGRLYAECREIFEGIGSGRYTFWGDEGGRGHDATSSVLHDCRAKVESGRLKVSNEPGRFIQRVGREETGKPQLTVRTGVGIDRGADDPLSWVEPDAISLNAILVADQGRKAAERALRDEAARRQEQERVARTVRQTIDRFLDQADERARNEKAPLTKILLMRAPVGSGKTSTTIERIAARHRRGKPIVFFLPSYANIDEAVARASDRRSAAGASVTKEFRESVAEARNLAEARSLKVGILKGVERAGCTRKDQRAFLRKQGAPAHGLCEARVKATRDMEAETVYCSDHPKGGGSCPVIAERKALAECDVVFAPTVFLTIGLPKELKEACCAVIIDERCAFELLRYDSMPLASLLLPRPEPRIQESDGEGVTPQDLLLERDRAARFVHDALARGEDPAAALFAAGAADPTLLADAKSAKTVAARAQRSAAQVVPNVSVEYLQQVFDRAKADDIRQENRLWGVILERLEGLRGDAFTRSLAEAAGIPVDPAMRQARGEREERIQVLHRGEAGDHVRISWREEPCLTELPTFLLDASGDAEILEKGFGRDVERVEIEAYLHVRTVVCLDSNHSTGSLCAELGADREAQSRAARKMRSVRRTVNNVAHVKAGGRVGVVLPLRARRAMQTAHAEAPNVDVMHYGAVRGLDFAKRHKALITVGRHEFPVWIIDALAGALTYDDVTPERPFDRNGDGLTDAGEPLSVPMVDRTYPLRDGRDLVVQVPEYPGRWARAIQAQFREEELVQSMGRLRPVYRDDVGLWVAVSRVLPHGIVVDAVTSLRSLSAMKGAGAHFEGIRRAGVADPALIRQVAPDAADGPTTLATHGLAGAVLSSEMAAGMDVWSVTVEGETRVVQVPGYYDEAASEIVDAYDRAGKRVDSLRLVKEGTGKVRSEAKPADRIDEELGSREERRAAEADARAVAQGHVPAPSRPFGPDSVMSVGRAPAATDVEVAMILATQCSVDPKEAARLNATANLDEAGEEAETATGRTDGAPLPSVPTLPGSPAAMRALAGRRAPDGTRATGRDASACGAVSLAPPAAPALAPGAARPLRLAPGLVPQP